MGRDSKGQAASVVLVLPDDGFLAKQVRAALVQEHVEVRTGRHQHAADPPGTGWGGRPDLIVARVRNEAGADLPDILSAADVNPLSVPVVALVEKCDTATAVALFRDGVRDVIDITELHRIVEALPTSGASGPAGGGSPPGTRSNADRKVLSVSPYTPVAIGSFKVDGSVGPVWTPAAAQLFGFQPDVPGTTQIPSISPNEQDRIREACAEAVASGIAGPIRVTAIGPDEDRAEIEIAFLHVEGSQGDLVVAFVIDLELDSHLRRRLREADRRETIGRLVGGVAHDFNNALTAIKGYLHLLGSLAGSDPRVAKYVAKSAESVEHAAHLSDRLLLFTRTARTVVERFDLNQSVREMQTLISRTIGNRIEVMAQLTDDDVTIVGRRVEIEQVVMGLAVRACDEMGEGGKLLISTSLRAMEGPDPRGQVVRLTIGHECVRPEPDRRESESGIAQVDPDAADSNPVRLDRIEQVVREHYGTMQESRAGGSYRIVEFPVANPLDGPIEDRRRRGDTLPLVDSSLSVLVVDSDRGAQAMIREVLSSLGYSVVAVGSVDEATSAIGRVGVPAVVVIDQSLTSGIAEDLTSQLEENIPIVCMGDYPNSGTPGSTLAASRICTISKPFGIPELLRAIHSVAGPPESE